MGNRFWLQLRVSLALTRAELQAGWREAGWAWQLMWRLFPAFLLAMLAASGLQGSLAPHGPPTLIEVLLGLAGALFTLARVNEVTGGEPFAGGRPGPRPCGGRLTARLRALATGHVGLATAAGLLLFEPTTGPRTLLFSVTAGGLAWFCASMFGVLSTEL